MKNETFIVPNEYSIVDGRSLRRTGRTEQFSTKVHPKFKSDLAQVAQLTGKNYNVILEECLELYVSKISTIPIVEDS